MNIKPWYHVIFLKLECMQDLIRGLDVFNKLLQPAMGLGMLNLVGESRLINLIYDIRWMGDAWGNERSNWGFVTVECYTGGDRLQ